MSSLRPGLSVSARPFLFVPPFCSRRHAPGTTGTQRARDAQNASPGDRDRRFAGVPGPDTIARRASGEQGRRVPLSSTITVWLARAAWFVVAITGGAAIGDALGDRSRSVQVIGTAGAWVGFAAGAAALAVTGVLTLTLARAVIPGSIVVAAVAIAGGADPSSGIALAAPAIAATGLVASAEFGRVYLQASAYGDELRFGLRPPFGYVLASGATWLMTAAAVVLAPVALAGRAWPLAVPALVVAVAGVVLLPIRWHQLSRRWLVLVPAGVVVHDPVVLADTLMLHRRTIESLAIDDRGVAAQTAADLTGPTPGLAIEVRLGEAATAVLAARPGSPNGTAIHLTALVVSPTRPGSALRAAAARGLPVA